MIPSSSTTLQAAENSAAGSHKDQGFFLSNRMLDEQMSADDDDSPISAQASEKNTRFLIAEGRASFYAARFHGRRTASGEHFDRRDYTAAHRSLPFGTKVRVTNLANGRQVLVKINDRGPHLKSRIIDISQAAAREIGMGGVGNVRIEAYD